MSTASSSPTGRSSLQVPRPQPPSPGLSPLSLDKGQGSVYPEWASSDPRSSSTQSLAPSEAGDINAGGRRTLLMIYIHGFMGNDSSFRSFPAHVHAYLKDALVETHVIHSKIYPRYKTYKAIDVARDNFSAWLEPHESDTTDVILAGHSMGGVLAADIVLMPNKNPASSYPFKHRILGTISLDSPFLGLHPGIIMSGIASLFRKEPVQNQNDDGSSSQAATTSPALSPSISADPSLYSTLSPPSGITSPTGAGTATSTTSLTSAASDPYFNPPFFNDVQFKDRGWFRNVAHFAKKHQQENIFGAAYSHIMNHLEFGACLADYPGLNSRYEKLRQLEDVDDLNLSGHSKPGDARVRFCNYYTLSTGIPKQPAPGAEAKPNPQSPHLRPEQAETRRSSHESSRASTPRISIEDRSDGERPVVLQEIEPQPEEDSPEPANGSAAQDAPPPAYSEMDNAGPEGAGAGAQQAEASQNPEPQSPALTQTLSLPAIPPLPQPPQAPDLDSYTDPESRKQAEKEAKRAQKTYDQAVKDRDKAVKERQKLIEKQRRKVAKEAEKKVKEERKRQEKEEAALKKEAERQAKAAASPVPPPSSSSALTGPDGKKEEKKKERKFIMLPKKVKEGRDDTWILVYMQGVDEVGAHCGLFLPGPHYERLVGDVASRVVSWVHEDATRRAIQGMDQ